jgi:hypothetical protein
MSSKEVRFFDTSAPKEAISAGKIIRQSGKWPFLSIKRFG